MMNIIEKARFYRTKIEDMAESLTDEDSLDFQDFFPKWQNNLRYTTGVKVRYDDILYKCLQEHTSQDDWTPDVAVSLWTKVSDPAIEFPDWVQPTGAHDAYMTGDKVSHNNLHWTSTIDNNIWEPGVYGWDNV